MTIAYRDAEPLDAEFVVPVWSSSYKMSYQSGMIWADDWAKVMHPMIRRVLELPGVRTLVAYENTDPSFLYGFITFDPTERIPVVYYVYVKENYRSRISRGGVRLGPGYARGLFAAAGIDPGDEFVYACRTPVVDRIKMADKIPRARFNPEPARYPRELRKKATW